MSDSFWWVSFSGEEGSRGVVITPDEEGGDVAMLCHRLHIWDLNPGGHVMAGSAPRKVWEESNESHWLEPENLNRLIPPDELKLVPNITIWRAE